LDVRVNVRLEDNLGIAFCLISPNGSWLYATPWTKKHASRRNFSPPVGVAVTSLNRSSIRVPGMRCQMQARRFGGQLQANHCKSRSRMALRNHDQAQQVEGWPAQEFMGSFKAIQFIATASNRPRLGLIRIEAFDNFPRRCAWSVGRIWVRATRPTESFRSTCFSHLTLGCPLRLLKRRKRTVKLGDFTALTLPTEGAHSIERQPKRASLRTHAALRPKPAGSCWPSGILLDPMGHERTGEAHH